MKKINNEEFDNSIISNNYVIIEFYADWCGPCKMMTPILDDINETIDNVTIFKVDVDNEYELPDKFQVRNIPTTLYFKDGVLINKTVGVQSREKILNTLGIKE